MQTTPLLPQPMLPAPGHRDLRGCLTGGSPCCAEWDMAAYSNLVMDHFEHPRNSGEMADPDGEATVANPVCGDRMRVMIRVSDGRIAEVRWLTRGCPPAIATSSFASEMVAGWSLDDIDGLSREAIADAIGGLPKDKVHCSVLAADALRGAVRDYRARRP